MGVLKHKTQWFSVPPSALSAMTCCSLANNCTDFSLTPRFLATPESLLASVRGTYWIVCLDLLAQSCATFGSVQKSQLYVVVGKAGRDAVWQKPSCVPSLAENYRWPPPAAERFALKGGWAQSTSLWPPLSCCCNNLLSVSALPSLHVGWQARAVSLRLSCNVPVPSLSPRSAALVTGSGVPDWCFLTS